MSSFANFQERKRTTERLLGGWDTTAEEYKSLGFTVGLPPGYFNDDLDTRITDLSSIIESHCEDMITGPASDCEHLMTDTRQFCVHIVFRNNNNLTDAQIHKIIESQMKDCIQEYSGNGIWRVEMQADNKTLKIWFKEENFVRMFRENYDILELDGSMFAITSFYYPGDDSFEFCQNNRSNLKIVVIHGKVNFSKFEELFDFQLLKTENNFTFLKFPSIEDAKDFVYWASKNDIDAAIRNFPGPSHQKQIDLAPNSVVTLKTDDIKLSQILDQNEIYTKIVDSKIIPDKGLKTLILYNIIHKNVYSNDNVFMEAANELVQFAQQFGKIKSSGVKDNDELKELTYIPFYITFESSSSARECQNEISGRFFLGRIVITQLSE